MQAFPLASGAAVCHVLVFGWRRVGEDECIGESLVDLATLERDEEVKALNEQNNGRNGVDALPTLDEHVQHPRPVSTTFVPGDATPRQAIATTKELAGGDEPPRASSAPPSKSTCTVM